MAILRVTNEPSVDTSCACRLMLADTLTGPVIATRSRRIWMRPIWPFGAPSRALGCAFSHSSRENIVHSAFITLRFRRASNVLRRPSTRLTSFLRRGAHADRTQIARRSPFRAPFRAPRSVVSSEAIKGHQWALVLGLVGETHLAMYEGLDETVQMQSDLELRDRDRDRGEIAGERSASRGETLGKGGCMQGQKP